MSERAIICMYALIICDMLSIIYVEAYTKYYI